MRVGTLRARVQTWGCSATLVNARMNGLDRFARARGGRRGTIIIAARQNVAGVVEALTRRKISEPTSHLGYI